MLPRISGPTLNETSACDPPPDPYIRIVSTVAEIESAIQRLPEAEVTRLAAWLQDFRQRPPTSGSGVHHELDALIGTWREDAEFDAAVRAFEQVDEAAWK